jgi:hypothetical protein
MLEKRNAALLAEGERLVASLDSLRRVMEED